MAAAAARGEPVTPSTEAVAKAFFFFPFSLFIPSFFLKFAFLPFYGSTHLSPLINNSPTPRINK